MNRFFLISLSVLLLSAFSWAWADNYVDDVYSFPATKVAARSSKSVPDAQEKKVEPAKQQKQQEQQPKVQFVQVTDTVVKAVIHKPNR